MLSTYLPGQEAGNVDFVKESGFGDYSPEPEASFAHYTVLVQLGQDFTSTPPPPPTSTANTLAPQ